MTPISIVVYHINHQYIYPQKGNQSLFGEAMQTKRGASIKQVLMCYIFMFMLVMMMYDDDDDDDDDDIVRAVECRRLIIYDC